MRPDHPDFEELSAYHDGEAPEWADHLAQCTSCRLDLDGLTALSDTIARVPLAASGTDGTDDAVTRAVAAAGRSTPVGPGARTGRVRHSAQRAARARPARRRQWVLGVSTAAVLAVSIAIGATVASKGPHREMTRDALSADGARPTAGAAAGRSGSVVEGGDLGEISDRATLVARVGADLSTGNQGRSAQVAPASPEADARTASPAAGAAVTSPPCEIEARADPGDRGVLVYRASAVETGVPAVVLAFGSADGSGRITVEARSRSDCRLLLQGAIP